MLRRNVSQVFILHLGRAWKYGVFKSKSGERGEAVATTKAKNLQSRKVDSFSTDSTQTTLKKINIVA